MKRIALALLATFVRTRATAQTDPTVQVARAWRPPHKREIVDEIGDEVRGHSSKRDTDIPTLASCVLLARRLKRSQRLETCSACVMRPQLRCDISREWTRLRRRRREPGAEQEIERYRVTHRAAATMAASRWRRSHRPSGVTTGTGLAMFDG
jgi:hypothetical protein